MMKKGFMMSGQPFSIPSTQTSEPAQIAKTYGINDQVAKTSATDQMPGNHKAVYFNSPTVQ